MESSTPARCPEDRIPVTSKLFSKQILKTTMKQILTTLLLLFSLTLSAQTVDVVGPKKKQQTTTVDANKRKAEAEAAAKKRAAEEAAKKRAADEAAAKKKAVQAQREEQARQEQLRREQAQREEQARQEQLHREQAQREEQARQEQLRRQQEELERSTHGLDNGHAWVDLGLPSGTKWATCNVGARNPWEDGNHYSWGEIKPEVGFDWESYKFCKRESKLTKYYLFCISLKGKNDGLTVLEPNDDAATVSWGKNWCMPSTSQFREIIDPSNTTISWTKMNGKEGYMITSRRNGNNIFLPAAGLRSGGRLQKSIGCYWSNELGGEDSSSAYYLGLGSNYGINDVRRTYGMSIRPVLVH